jgi:CheY-like chemotaxis protein
MFRVLVVDDDRALRTYMRLILRNAGYMTDEACNGLEALERVNLIRPDIILLDLMMPVMDGLETCRRLKQDPETKYIPILIVTVIESGPQKEAALSLGCNDFMTKPVKQQELLYKLKWWTKRMTDLPARLSESRSH